MNIPIYSNMTPKQRQWVHMGLAGLAFVALFMVVMAMIGGDPTAASKPSTAPSVKTLGGVPGDSVDPQQSWVGGAGKTITQLKEEVATQKDKNERQALDFKREIESLREEMKSRNVFAQGTTPSPINAPSPTPAPNRVEAGGTVPAERMGGVAGTNGLPPPRNMGATASPAPGAFPPGTPNGGAAPNAALVPQMVGAPVGMVKVAVGAGAGAVNANAPVQAAGQASATPAREGRRVENFLPVSFIRAVMLGGMDAPTGGQAQKDPIPVLFKLVDNAVLPNEFRSAVKDCFVVGDGFGEVSAERAYIRTQLLSCVLKNGQAVEVPIKGNVFGEDGKNGMRGKLITKQGAMLTNAALSGIAAGMGQAFANSTQTTSVSALGTTTTNGTSGSDILKAGLGTGASRALDRLAQYYINLAERTFPVIEIDAGRIVEIVITQGVNLDGAFDVSGDGYRATKTRRIDRTGLLNTVNETQDD